MPIEGGDIRFPCGAGDGDLNYYGYDIEAHARNVGLKYGVEGVTPEVLRMATQSQDTHLGGCALYRDNPQIVKERLQAIVRSQQGPTELDYIFDALAWIARTVKGLVLAIFGIRPPGASETVATASAPTPEQIVIDAIEAQPQAPTAPTPEQVVITAIQASGEVNSRGIAPLFAAPQQSPPATPAGQLSPVQMLQMQQMQSAAVLQGAAQMIQPVPVVPVMPFIDIP